MARATRQVPNLYFGQPGRALMTLPWPSGGIEKPYERQTYDFLTGSGLHQVSSLAVGSRSFVINWDGLGIESFNKLDQYRIGANGPGPFVLIDPSAPNLLPANVAAASGLLTVGSVDTISAGGGDGSPGYNADPAFIHRSSGWASLRWRWAATPSTNPVLGVQPQFRNWFGHPVVAGLPYAFSSWVTVDGVTETNATLSMRLGWLDAAGAQLSESTGGNVAVTTWTRLSVIATAPVGAVYCAPRWVALGSSLNSASTLYIDEPLLEQDSVVNEWAMGTGIRPVEIVALGESVPFETRFRTGTTMTLRELAK